MAVRIAVLALMVCAIAATDASAQSPSAPSPDSVGVSGNGAQIQPAPGGGEMVILGPESRYVIGAVRDADGTVRGTCARNQVGSSPESKKQGQP